MVEYKKHELRTHILDQSPEMYVGSISPEAISSFIVDDENKIVRKTINYSPALYKIFDELIVNAADHVVRMNLSNLTDKQIVKNIKVTVDRENNSISVYNDGDGISIEIHEGEGPSLTTSLTMPRRAWHWQPSLGNLVCLR